MFWNDFTEQDLDDSRLCKDILEIHRNLAKDGYKYSKIIDYSNGKTLLDVIENKMSKDFNSFID